MLPILDCDDVDNCNADTDNDSDLRREDVEVGEEKTCSCTSDVEGICIVLTENGCSAAMDIDDSEDGGELGADEKVS